MATILLHSNVGSYTVSASNGYQTGQEVENLLTYNPNDKWVSRNDDDNDQFLQISLPSGSVDTIIVHNHNLDSVIGNGGVYLVKYDTDDYATPEVVDALAAVDNGIYYATFPSTDARYWRIIYSGSLYAEPYIGNVMLGTRIVLRHDYIYGYKINNYAFTTNEIVTLDGTIRTNQAVQGRNTTEISFRYYDDATKSDWISFIQDVKGKLYPFYFRNHLNEISYMRMAEDYTPMQAARYNLNDVQTVKMKAVNTETYTYSYDEILDVFELEWIEDVT